MPIWSHAESLEGSWTWWRNLPIWQYNPQMVVLRGWWIPWAPNLYLAAVNLFFGIFVKWNVGTCFACHEEKLGDHVSLESPAHRCHQTTTFLLVYLGHKKNLLLSIILIRLLVYYTLHITAQYNPLYNLNNQGFHCLCMFDQQKNPIQSYPSPMSTGICQNKKQGSHGVLVCWDHHNAFLSTNKY